MGWLRGLTGERRVSDGGNIVAVMRKTLGREF